ncbi:hypothetical protein TNCV_1480841 [Trichonephila clavipes]|nr:hypothetical protein TNCV_1480841 [Trichonephila clavipes]
MTPLEDPAIVFASAQLILLYLGTAAVAFPARPDMLYWRKICRPCCQSALIDRVSQEIAPHTVTPFAVCRLTINAGSDRWPVRLWSSSLRLNRDSSLDTSPVCHTPMRSAKIQSTLFVGSVVSVLADVGSSPTSVSRLLMVSLDGTGCLEGGKWR